MPATARRVPEQKRVTITTKRQFTIPQKYYTDLGFDREAICIKGDGCRQKSDLQLKLCLKMQGKQHWEKENTPLMMMFSDRRIDHEETDQREKSAFPSSGV